MLGPVPVDAFARAALAQDEDTPNYYNAACRDATAVVRTSEWSGASEVVRVADPRFVQLVQFPTNGTITAIGSAGSRS